NPDAVQRSIASARRSEARKRFWNTAIGILRIKKGEASRRPGRLSPGDLLDEQHFLHQRHLSGLEPVEVDTRFNVCSVPVASVPHRLMISRRAHPVDERPD